MSDDKNSFHDEEQEYQALLKDSLTEMNNFSPYTYKRQTEIVQTGKRFARNTNIMISLAILLLIIPMMTLATYLYYGIGGKADHLIDVVTKTIYVTQPNMNLRKLEVEDEIGFFSMNIKFDVFKRIGKEDYRAGSYDIDFFLDDAAYPRKEVELDRTIVDHFNKESAVLIHPDANPYFSTKDNWDILKKIPEGTVTEIYVSLNHVIDPDELKKILPKNIELRWLAVDTGMDGKQEDEEGVPITPLGYPAQPDPTTWSPFKDGDNEKVFLDILSTLEKNEDVAQKVSGGKSLSLSSRLAYVKEHGIKVYGAVITGPTEELRKLENMSTIRVMKVGEMKLWNWE